MPEINCCLYIYCKCSAADYKTHMHTKHTCTQNTHAHKAHMHTKHTCTQNTHAHKAHMHTKHTCTQSTHAHKTHMHTKHTCTQSTHSHKAHMHTKHTCTQSTHAAGLLFIHFIQNTKRFAFSSKFEFQFPLSPRCYVNQQKSAAFRVTQAR